MRAVSLVSIAFGLAIAASTQAAPAGAKSPADVTTTASTKTPAASKTAGPTKAKSSSRAKTSTRKKAAARTSAAAAPLTAQTPAAPVQQAAVAGTPGSLLGGAPTGEPSAAHAGAGLAPVLTPALVPQPGPAMALNPYGFPFLAGVYHCELDRSVDVRQVAPDMKTAVVQWDKKIYTLHAVSARTGALRYEDEASGLVWLIIAGKSMLLDTKNGKQLANECKA